MPNARTCHFWCVWNMIPEPISAGLSYSATSLLLAALSTGGERAGRRGVPGQDGPQH